MGGQRSRHKSFSVARRVVQTVWFLTPAQPVSPTSHQPGGFSLHYSTSIVLDLTIGLSNELISLETAEAKVCAWCMMGSTWKNLNFWIYRCNNSDWYMLQSARTHSVCTVSETGAQLHYTSLPMNYRYHSEASTNSDDARRLILIYCVAMKCQ